MNWSPATSDEHKAVLSFIRRIRKHDIILGLIFAILFLIFTAIGVAMIIDGAKYSVGAIIIGVLFGLISLGSFLSDTNRSRHIRKNDYEVSRCRVISRSIAGGSRTITRYVTVLCSNGNKSKYKVHAFVYRRAKENASALLVDYTHEHKGHREISIDLVICGDSGDDSGYDDE